MNILLESIAVNRQGRAAMGIPDQWKQHPVWAGLAFQEALEEPINAKPKLKKLLNEPSVLE